MSTVYPGALDTFTNPVGTDLVTGPTGTGHSGQHDNHNDAILALEAKVGITGSAVAGTIDKRVATLEAAPAATSPTCGQVFSNGFSSLLRQGCNGSGGSGTGSLFLGGVSAPKAFTAANMVMYANAGTTGATLLKYGLYLLDASGNGTLVAATANQSANQAATGKVSFALVAPYLVVAGASYAMSILCVGATSPTYARNSGGFLAAQSVGQQPFESATLAAQTDLPASFTFGSLVGSATKFYSELTT